tara:strand:+ start:286 stop:471 length:186 start_codon:yes stop_codon:yes gene_type:complete
MKDKCASCGVETLYDKEHHIDHRLGYVECAGQLCLDCYGEIYGVKPELRDGEKLTKKNKEL